jgi:hypothetical protein
MAHKFLTDVDVKGSINVAGKVESAELDSTKLAINGVELQTPAGVAGPITVATSTQITEINETLETKQENLVVEAYSGIVLSADNKIAVDTSVIATAETVAAAQSAADAAQDAADENAEAIEAIKTTGINSTVTLTDPEQTDDVAAIVAHLTAAGKTAVKGDTAIVKRTISGTKVSHTAYVFDGANWAAMDGNYSASNVYLANSIKMSGFTSVGNISITSGGFNSTALAAGKSIEDVLKALFAKESQPSATKPSISAATFYKDGAKMTSNTSAEVGTSIVFSYDSTFSPGSYTAFTGSDGKNLQNPTGVTVSAWEAKLVESGNGSQTQTLATEDGTFTAIKVAAGKTYSMYVKAGHSASTASGLTSDGNPSNPEVSIAAVDIANVTSSNSNKQLYKASNTVTAYRKAFFGSFETPLTVDQMTSAMIRGLSSTTSALTSGKELVANVTTGHKQVIFALPTGQSKTAVNHTSSLNALVTTSFPKIGTVDVADASGTDTHTYDIYACEQSEAFGAGNVFTMTI